MLMTKLLTIAIPTFNRAESLDRQLSWLALAIKGYECDCEILVSDNCSTDNTQGIAEKWQAIFDKSTFRYNKNKENIGVLKNIAYCLESAKTKYVWAIGDDDFIKDRAVEYVLTKLKKHENLSLLFLNFSGRNKNTNEPVHPPTISDNRWFDVDSEDGCGDGKEIFEYCFEKSIGAVIFLTATVYRTDLVRHGLQMWKDAPDNWIFLAYLAGYCAANGSIIVTKETYVECIVGTSYWQKEPKSALLMQYKHTPEVIIKLEENGFSKRFCRQMIVKHFREANLKVFIGALRRWPWYTIKTVVPFISLASLSAFQIVSLSDLRIDKLSNPNAERI